MDALISKLKKLRKGKVRALVNRRLSEFKNVGLSNSKNIFKELCFCILTANFNAERSMKIQKKINNGFLTLSYFQLAKKLKELGHRYPKTRAKYIVNARKYAPSLKRVLTSFDDAYDLRTWLVKNIPGLGYKEASHFLRNIGYTDFAIIDFHIINVLVENHLIRRPKTLTKKKYLEIENVLKKIAKQLNLNLAELDLYLWFSETGKVLK